MPDYVFIDARTYEVLEYQYLENMEEARDWVKRFFPDRKMNIAVVVSYSDEEQSNDRHKI